MSKLLEVELDGLPPTVNHLYRSMKNGRRYKTAAGREYQDIVSEVMRRQYEPREMYGGRAGLTIAFTVSDSKRWDIDNRIKAIQDCLTLSGVLKDDSQIDKLEVSRKRGSKSATYMCLYDDP